MDENKKPDEEEKKPSEDKKAEAEQPSETQQKPEQKADEKPAEGSQDEQKDKPEADTKDKEKPQEKPSESVTQDEKGGESDKPAPPEMTREQELEAENFKLKTQIEAMRIGFNPDCMEDAVVLAESIAKRDGSDITAALQSVAKKYPDWKSEENGKQKGGFKIGADTSKQKPTSDEKLNKAFGIKKKG